MTILSRTEQTGRSMVEMLGVLAIIGVLSVGGISGYSKAMAKFKLTKAQDQITMLLMNIRTAYATSPSYDGLTNSVATGFNIAPSDMVTDSAAGTMNGAFGGAVMVGACDENGAPCATVLASANTASYFFITMADLGREACLSLATSDWGSDGMVGMVVGGQGITSANLPLPLTGGAAGGGGGGAIDADTLCVAGANRQGTDISWVYY